MRFTGSYKFKIHQNFLFTVFAKKSYTNNNQHSNYFNNINVNKHMNYTYLIGEEILNLVKCLYLSKISSLNSSINFVYFIHIIKLNRKVFHTHYSLKYVSN